MNGNETVCGALGVNPVMLLVLLSMVGSDLLHPQINAEFARNVMQLILAQSPATLTPGNEVAVRGLCCVLLSVLRPCDTHYFLCFSHVTHAAAWTPM